MNDAQQRDDRDAPDEPPVLEAEAYFHFGGLGGGALGFKGAEVHLLGTRARFRIVGGVDFDANACTDFAYLTGVKELCRDVRALTIKDLHRVWAPHRGVYDGRRRVVFLSPPCKGASGLLGSKKAKTAKYVEMNRLAIVWMTLMFEAGWEPDIVVLENVPRLKSRARQMLLELCRMLEDHGYALHEGFHDCGEFGGLAQHRRRYLLVARHQKRVPELLFQPVKKRVRGVGEVIGPLPFPGDIERGGKMHRRPNTTLRNLLRLAAVQPRGTRLPNGAIAHGDYRDLPAVLGAEAPPILDDVMTADARWIPQPANPNMHLGKYVVLAEEEPARPVTTATRVGSGALSVADRRWGGGTLGVKGWHEPSDAVTGSGRIACGPFSCADERFQAPAVALALPCAANGQRFTNLLHVGGWAEPAPPVTGATRPCGGAPSVADARFVLADDPNRHRHILGVNGWWQPSATLTGQCRPMNGPFALADERFAGHVVVGPPDAPVRLEQWIVRSQFEHAYRTIHWDEAAFVIASKSWPGCGAYAVGDVRISAAELAMRCHPRAGAYGVIDWNEAAKLIAASASIDNAPVAVCDPRRPDDAPIMVISDLDKPPPEPLWILAADGTCHRPFTTLELALLQGFPFLVDGRPLCFAGRSDAGWRERIGNAVPPPTALAIGEQVLLTVLASALGTMLMSGADVWVAPDDGAEGDFMHLRRVTTRRGEGLKPLLTAAQRRAAARRQTATIETERARPSRGFPPSPAPAQLSAYAPI